MKNSNIAESVFEVNLEYSRLQNRTKELFFRCLQEGRDEFYFERELRMLWGDDNISYLEQQIIDYRNELHKENTGKENTESIVVDGMKILTGAIIRTNELFKKAKITEYKTRYESYGYKVNKEEYLEKLIPKYTSNIKPYYEAGAVKDVENIVRFVSPSTYNSMVYNTTITRNGWVQTLNDGLEMKIKFYYIPNHSFSCKYCLVHQEKKLSREQCLNMLGTADEGKTELLHPNCKCVLTFWDSSVRFKKLNKSKLEEQYHIREKVMSLELEKERQLSDKKIYKRLQNNGYDTQADIDKINNKVRKINSTIKDLQKALPTTALKKQVVAR